MKKEIFIIICVCFLSCELFSQQNTLNGTYVSPMIGMENIVYIFEKDTFMYTSGDVIECGVRGETEKGLYSIENKKINFVPLPPKYFQKSVITYDKEDYRNDRYDFSITVSNLQRDSIITQFDLCLFDSTDLILPFLSITSMDSVLYFSYGGIQNIVKIELEACGYEKILLDFDPAFHGRHNYSIRLEEKVYNYVYRPPYSWSLIEIKPRFIKVKHWGETMLMVKSEYVTNEFIKTGLFNEN
jgi:hypothetical protein